MRLARGFLFSLSFYLSVEYSVRADFAYPQCEMSTHQELSQLCVGLNRLSIIGMLYRLIDKCVQDYVYCQHP